MHLIPEIVQQRPGLEALRRDLHAHPELCFNEFRTADVVAAVKGTLEAYRFFQSLPAETRRQMAETYALHPPADPLYRLFATLETEANPARASHMIRKTTARTHSYRHVRYPDTALAGKVVVITGGGTGMGRSLALEAARRGAFDQIAIIEEPFPEEYKKNVSGLGVRIAADESAHCDHDVEERISLGYGAIALKPIAKTLSMTLKIAKVAHDAKVPMFCADLTVGPIQVDWNKTFACRLAPLPGMKIGVVETNGHQNYKHWADMQSYHPAAGSKWMQTKGGCFELDNDFYARSGGILEDSEHYRKLVFA